MSTENLFAAVCFPICILIVFLYYDGSSEAIKSRKAEEAKVEESIVIAENWVSNHTMEKSNYLHKGSEKDTDIYVVESEGNLYRVSVSDSNGDLHVNYVLHGEVDKLIFKDDSNVNNDNVDEAEN